MYSWTKWRHPNPSKPHSATWRIEISCICEGLLEVPSCLFQPDPVHPFQWTLSNQWICPWDPVDFANFEPFSVQLSEASPGLGLSFMEVTDSSSSASWGGFILTLLPIYSWSWKVVFASCPYLQSLNSSLYPHYKWFPSSNYEYDKWQTLCCFHCIVFAHQFLCCSHANSIAYFSHNYVEWYYIIAFIAQSTCTFLLPKCEPYGQFNVIQTSNYNGLIDGGKLHLPVVRTEG